MRIKLTDSDKALLDRPIRGEGGFQDHLKKLQACVVGDELVIDSDALLERTVRYASKYGSGGFQGRLADLAVRIVQKKKEIETLEKEKKKLEEKRKLGEKTEKK